MSETDPLTELLNAALKGDSDAEQKVVSAVYKEMREQAGKLNRTNVVDPSVLVHEVWIRLFRGIDVPKFSNRRAFYGYATRAMRNLLIDHVRSKDRRRANEIDQLLISVETKARVHFIDLDAALNDLSKQYPRRSEVVQLRFFAGLSLTEIADELGVSLGTVERDWRLARAVLRLKLLDRDGNAP